MSGFVPRSFDMQLNQATGRYEAYTINREFLVSVERRLWEEFTRAVTAAEPHGGVMGAFACGPEVWRARHEKHPELDIVVTAAQSTAMYRL